MIMIYIDKKDQLIYSNVRLLEEDRLSREQGTFSQWASFSGAEIYVVSPSATPSA